MRLRRPTLALLVSVALHAAVLLWLSTRPAPPPQAPPLPQAVDLQISYLDPPAAPAAPVPALPSPPGGPARRRSGAPAAASPKPSGGGRGEPKAPGADAPLATGGGEPATSSRGSWVLGLPTLEGPDGRTSRAAPGRTRHPGDPIEKDSPEVEAARVRARVQGIAEGTLAAIQIADGNLHPYFTELRKAMEAASKDPPPFKAPNLGQSLVSDYLQGAESFGRTGNPFAGAPGINGRPDDAVSAMRQAQQRSGFVDPTATLQAQSGALRAAAGENRKPALVAVVELFQGPDGSLRRIEISQSSGQKGFDDHVLKTAPTALASLAPPPREASPKVGRGEDVHTTWAFEGRVEYRRHVKDMNLKDDGWYLVAALPAALFTGNFEETTGDVQVVDVRQVRYACTVRLLQLH